MKATPVGAKNEAVVHDGEHASDRRQHPDDSWHQSAQEPRAREAGIGTIAGAHDADAEKAFAQGLSARGDEVNLDELQRKCREAKDSETD